MSKKDYCASNTDGKTSDSVIGGCSIKKQRTQIRFRYRNHMIVGELRDTRLILAHA